MERIFNKLNCTDDDKITLAEYQLEGNAKNWWRASKDAVFPEGTAKTWDGFVKAFNGKYNSDCARDRKMTEFMQLNQNNLSVDQYEAKFSELSRFAPRLVENKEDKAKRFLNGLRTDIRRQLVPLNLKDYSEIYEQAQLIEHELMKDGSGTMARSQY
ncbi:uncharacterized protein LOC130136284 [Syzygium oleosum]|uniref:uncharacterized protein LOC130136284 n=1 Tax=Syzygium oleosum TaxID=219896 RepID=UPI0024B9F8C1|nr:uncharacterized protein LOC130136284 [Syzygium oleosum]